MVGTLLRQTPGAWDQRPGLHTQAHPSPWCTHSKSLSLSGPPHLRGEGAGSPSRRLLLSFNALKCIKYQPAWHPACLGPSSSSSLRQAQRAASTRSPGDRGN